MKLPDILGWLPSLSDVGARVFAMLVVGVAGVMVVSKAEIPPWLVELVSTTGPAVGPDPQETSLTNYVRFREVALDGSDSIHTGLRFPDLAHMRQPELGWCYLSRPEADGRASYRLTLANQTGSAAPVFADIDDETARTFGRSADEIERLARLHCDFTVPN